MRLFLLALLMIIIKVIYLIIHSKTITNILVMTFARVYVNQDSTSMYYELFTRVFKVISRITQKPVYWQHLHSSGFGALVMDMDSKQMSGRNYLIYS